jgi:hypothetical protein
MKNKALLKTLLWVMSLACVNAIRAQDASGQLSPGKETLQNADFSDGTTHWRGDLHLAAAESSTDLTTSSSTASGIAVEMGSHGRIVWQEIKTFDISPDTGVDVTITYSTSSDFALKVHESHADNSQPAKVITEPIMVTLSLTPKVGLAEHGGFSTPTAGFYCIPDPGAGSGTFQKTLALPMPKGTPDSFWFKLWFPPGTGIIFFKKISVTMHNGTVKRSAGSPLQFLRPSDNANGGPGNSPQTSGTTAPTPPVNNQ